MTSPPEELAAVRKRREIGRRKAYRMSRLVPHRAEIVALRRDYGASIRDLCAWLRYARRVRVSPSTVWRFLSALPEIKEGELDE